MNVKPNECIIIELTILSLCCWELSTNSNTTVRGNEVIILIDIQRKNAGILALKFHFHFHSCILSLYINDDTLTLFVKKKSAKSY